MKYRDLITVFAGIGFILSIAYVIGKDYSVWYAPVIMGVVMFLIWYYLWKK
jgi:hypothetical protein